MRIAFLNGNGALGGAEIVVLEMIGALVDRYPEWEVWLVTGQEGPLAKRARELGARVEVVTLPFRLARMGDTPRNGGLVHKSARLLSTISRLFRAIPQVLHYERQIAGCLLKIAPDLIHSNGMKMHILSARSSPKGVPVLWHMHDYLGSRAIMRRLLRWCSGRCDLALAVSESIADDVSKVCGPKLRVSRLYNVVDPGLFAPKGPTVDLDARAGLEKAPAGTLRIGMIAAFAKWKGHDVFLGALASLSPSLSVRGYIVGGPLYQTDGSQFSEEELRSIVNQLGITHRVGFTGFVTDRAEVMRSLDIVVHASTRPEPFGMVIVEAMATGRAVIIAAKGGAAEIVTDGSDGLTHDAGDVQGLATQLETLATNAELRVRLGQRARQTIEERFSNGNLAADLAEIYQSLIDGGRVTRRKPEIRTPTHVAEI